MADDEKKVRSEQIQQSEPATLKGPKEPRRQLKFMLNYFHD